MYQRCDELSYNGQSTFCFLLNHSLASGLAAEHGTHEISVDNSLIFGMIPPKKQGVLCYAGCVDKYIDCLF